jgi:hypothetical protein
MTIPPLQQFALDRMPRPAYTQKSRDGANGRLHGQGFALKVALY